VNAARFGGGQPAPLVLTPVQELRQPCHWYALVRYGRYGSAWYGPVGFGLRSGPLCSGPLLVLIKGAVRAAAAHLGMKETTTRPGFRSWTRFHFGLLAASPAAVFGGRQARARSRRRRCAARRCPIAAPQQPSPLSPRRQRGNGRRYSDKARAVWRTPVTPALLPRAATIAPVPTTTPREAKAVT
jgi:hypothetical protein